MATHLSIPELPDLPVKEAIPALLRALDTSNRAVLEAPPGAGKTTLVPLALLNTEWRGDGKILVLEPRRLATRAAAQRMADLMQEPLGQTVGYWVRMEHVVSARTRVEVVTEGILTRMLQEDPALEGVAAILFDEFHERNLQADLGLALALDAQAVLRPDLRILIMSATLDATGIGQWLQAPVISSEGKLYPVETHYLTPAEVAAAGSRPAERLQQLVPRAVRRAMAEHTGDVLVFLPGMGEMRRVAEQLENTLPAAVELHLLHGDLALSRQMAAIQPSADGNRKVVLATSIAETSLTIEGVKVVVDGGYARVPRFLPRTGLTTLVTTAVSKAAADQRRGRAGRLGPGVCYRLWSTADQLQLPERQTPEIWEADLSGLALELALWGIKDANTLQWLDTPPAAALSLARDLLLRLEAMDKTGQATPHGKAIATMGLTPRLGHLVIQGQAVGLTETACHLAALLAERDILRPQQQMPAPAPLPDLTLRLEILAGKRPPTPGFTRDENAIRRVQEQAQHLRQRLRAPKGQIDAHAAGLLTALAYPDRLAQRESHGRVRLISGQRASLATELFSEADYYSIAHLDTGPNPRILLAAPLDKAELLAHFSQQLEQVEEVRWDEATGRVQARKQIKLGALLLEDKAIPQPNPEHIAQALLQALQEKGSERLPWNDEALRTRQRIGFLRHISPADWPDVSDEALNQGMDAWLLPHLAGLRSMDQVNRLDWNGILLSLLSWEQQQALDRLAPTHLQVPSGSRIALDYRDPASPVLAVRLQEVFGLLDTPRIADGKVPLLLHLLSPASRPVQVTRDLRSFWSNGYFEVRKDLRGRYPKHHWPDDPLTAPPTRSVKRRTS
jgi:ATP-dependent helicase HrpB